MTDAAALLRSYATVFWDFDGVIKESLAVKADAFEQLFAPFGAALAARVRSHHERHGGLSRYEKLPMYLGWAGEEGGAAQLESYCMRLSALVRQQVIDCPWVPGAREYLEQNYRRQCFVLVTGTPQREIEDIVAALGIARWFGVVAGSPRAKCEAIRAALERAPAAAAILVGDSPADHEAAQTTGIDFLLRRTPFNLELQQRYRGPQCNDLASS